MTSPRLSAVINTYNRREMLLRCLDTLARQRLDRSLWEIVVVDDGSTDGAIEAVGKWAAAHPGVPLTSVACEHRGYGAARNAGIRAARGDVLLFLGDDILLWPGTLEEHLREHERFPDERVGVLGYVCWHPDLQSPLTDYAAESGFGFELMLRSGTQIAPWHAFYTCNVSVKRRLLERAGGFNEAMGFSSYDDTELGYRLARDYGLVLRLNYNAGAFHYHPLDARALRERLRGRRRLMAPLFTQHPELAGLSRNHLAFRYRLLNLAGLLCRPFEPVLTMMIRLLISIRLRGWEAYPLAGECPQIRCDALAPDCEKQSAAAAREESLAVSTNHEATP
jgi:glycosyltransferase involved in cell wall biosynthesis